jgi:sec-independent protein translocase protein TatC
MVPYDDNYTPGEQTTGPEENPEHTDEQTGGEEQEQGLSNMSFLEHLEALRWTILKSLIAVLVAAVGCYFFSRHIVTFLRMPGPENLKLIYLAPTEGFMIYIKVSIFSGLVVALPYVAYEFWKFVVPGLLDKERRLVRPIALFTTLCFLIGAAFAYTVIIPFGLKFLLGFQTDFLEANLTIGKYLGFVVTIIFVFGMVFELPVLSYFLTHVGIITPEFIRDKRPYGIVLIFIMAAILTPPDIVTQLMLAGPLILLYEISIWVSRAVSRKKRRQASRE